MLKVSGSDDLATAVAAQNRHDRDEALQALLAMLAGESSADTAKAAELLRKLGLTAAHIPGLRAMGLHRANHGEHIRFVEASAIDRAAVSRAIRELEAARDAEIQRAKEKTSGKLAELYSDLRVHDSRQQSLQGARNALGRLDAVARLIVEGDSNDASMALQELERAPVHDYSPYRRG